MVVGWWYEPCRCQYRSGTSLKRRQRETEAPLCVPLVGLSAFVIYIYIYMYIYIYIHSITSANTYNGQEMPE